MELIDNLARDLIRHDRETGAVLMGSVATDTSGDFHELFEPVCDELNPLLARFLSKRRTRSNLSIYDRLVRHLPFAANLGQAEFVPTRTFELVEVLRDRFPRHQLLLSDFDRLPQAIKGIGAPVVQTRYEGMVSLSFFCPLIPASSSKPPLTPFYHPHLLDGALYHLPRPTRSLRYLLSH